MAGKKISEFVIGKIINQNNYDEKNKNSMNLSNFYGIQELQTEINEDNECKIDCPSSNKSSPGSNPRWRENITGIKKNFKENETLKDLKEKLSENIDSSDENDYRSEAIRSPRRDIDCVDFKWFTTPKNENKRIKRVQNSELPKLIHKSLIENYQFPKARINSVEYPIKTDKKIIWMLIAGLLSLGYLFIPYYMIVIGFILGAGTCYIVIMYCGVYDHTFQKDVLSLPRLKDLQSPGIPYIQENNKDLDLYSSKESNYSCWINVLGVYDINVYNINQCHVVYMDIEDNALRIRRPKKRMTHRTLGKDKNHKDLAFISEVIINITDAKIDLLPTGLVLKRLWSKKYPICVNFSKKLGECASDNSFSDILNYKSHEIYIFGRTCRDKEELFRRLLNACSSTTIDFSLWHIVEQYLTKSNYVSEKQELNIPNKISKTKNQTMTAENESKEYNKKITTHLHNKEDMKDKELSTKNNRMESVIPIPQIAEYVRHMAKFMPSDLFLLSSEVMNLDINYVSCSPEIQCINAFLGRIFWDFLNDLHWVNIIKEKVQCKLQKIHLPQFLDDLSVVDINIGKEIPLIRKFTQPYLDSKGLWFDCDIAYTGGFSMILKTKVNLFNLRNQSKKINLDEDQLTNEPSTVNGSPDECIEYDIKTKSKSQNVNRNAALISSEEDSPESSSYSEESENESKPVSPTKLKESSKRTNRLVDKIAQSPYFAKITDNKYIQRGMELVSNTKLVLQVEIHCVSGTLAINIPPPPSDRVWYGFRQSPIIKLSAKPKVGEKEISLSKVTDFIEKKLLLEFQRVIILPNMDDIPVPLLINGNLKNYARNFY